MSSLSNPLLKLVRGVKKYEICFVQFPLVLRNGLHKSTVTNQDAKLYPNCDFNVWLRNCEQEVTEPLDGKITGEIPSWVHGTLIRNGPGATKVGTSDFKHVFDGSALLHRFGIQNGFVTYQCRFVRSDTFLKNHAAKRIIFTEFGTKGVPDPCQTIFSRVASIFKKEDTTTDNTMVSVYPFGDQVYTLTETPIIHRIDSKTLETLERKNLEAYVVNHTAHPHVMSNGDVYNLGMSVVEGKLKHAIVKFPFTEKGDMFEKAHIVCTMPARWPMYPSYMHSFGITANYFVLVEQPLCLSLFKIFKNKIFKDEFAKALQWHPDRETCIVLVDRRDGSIKRYRTESFAFFHIINSYEKDKNLVVDVATYNDAMVIEALYTEAIEGMQSNKEFAEWCRSRPKRIEIPLTAPEMSKVDMRLLVDTSCETPKINYEKYNGLPYNYCFGSGTDVDATHAAPLVKIDIKAGEFKLWYEEGWSPGEPVFVGRPGATEEDDGVLLSAMVRECPPQSAHAHDLTLLVLDARTMSELARARFRTPSPSPKSLHGWFLPESRKKEESKEKQLGVHGLMSG